ncbi:hypothetical protein LTR62_004084 [Meristemomyces frigidus]|uniref:triacylglycerol lipase n=1 Tax=Meristemomyces frigidus TaxID=1508187 RepID=A0AAN7TI00_9PEZI|nr:hypothetical protein LTR62_004084 [Meristemomyces frigidus]
MYNGSVLLACLLVLAGFGDAARTPQQKREQTDPYLILPPGSPNTDKGGRLSQDLGAKSFSLRHIYHHGYQKYPDLHKYIDIVPDEELRVTGDYGETYETAPGSLEVQAVTTNIQRLAKRKPADIDRLLQHAEIHGAAATLPSSSWTTDEVSGPNVTDKKSVVTFAKMASNAYEKDESSPGWKDVKGGFNYTDAFGWQQDGLRGHIFADEKNSTIVIGLKGTSVPFFDDPTTMDPDQSLRQKSHYYWAVRDLYHNVTERYPDSDVWLAGHSLGGVVSSLLALTYGLPALTFEAYPEAMAASRLGLPTPPGFKIGAHQSRVTTGVYHFGHTADPIFMGTCNGATSFCSIGGYAFQGLCHTGKTCTYDTVGDLGWRVGLGYHKISNVIRDVLEKYDTVPQHLVLNLYANENRNL